MKKIAAVGVSLLLVAMLAACRQEQPGNNNTVSEPALETQDEILVEGEEEQAEIPHLNETLPQIAGASLYRGVVSNVEENDDGLVITLEQVEGTDFGHKSLSVTVTSNTTTNMHVNEIAQDKYVEVYYGAPIGGDLPETVDAIMINMLADADLTVFNGIVESYTPEPEHPDSGTFLLRRDDGYEILFHYDEETQLYLNEISVGEKLNVYFDGTTTRSIPPQATAMEVRHFAEAE